MLFHVYKDFIATHRRNYFKGIFPFQRRKHKTTSETQNTQTCIKLLTCMYSIALFQLHIL